MMEFLVLLGDELLAFGLLFISGNRRKSAVKNLAVACSFANC